MLSVRTSEGYLESWDRNRIAQSIIRDCKTMDVMVNDEIAKSIAKRVERTIKKIDNDYTMLTPALIRAFVLTDVLTHGLTSIYRAYATVGIPIAKIKQIWGVNGDNRHDNANLEPDNQETMHKAIADTISKDAVMLLLPEELALGHLRGDYHIHDLEYFATRQFCLDSDLRYIFYYGLLPDGKGKTLPTARAAREPHTAFAHAAKALGSSQCNCAGGQGYQAFNILIAPYVYGLSYTEIKQLAQFFVFEMGQMTAARGAQAVFSSIQLFPSIPEVWKNVPVVAKGSISSKDGRLGLTYGHYEREVRLLFKAFMEIYIKGDARGRPFTFPKPEIVVTKEFIDNPTWDEPLTEEVEEPCGINNNTLLHASIVYELAPSIKELYELAFMLALTNGSPYFESQYHIENPLKSISCVQCCAYGFTSNEDTDPEFIKKLNFIDGEHFSLGSMQVVSLNLPRAAMKFGNFNDSVAYLRDLIDKCGEIFEIKREYIYKQKSPFVKQQTLDPNDNTKLSPPYCDHAKLSYVIGLVGLNEYVQILTGKQLHESDEAWDLGLKLVAALNLYCGKVAHEHNMTIALARTPAETTAQRFAVMDVLNPDYSDQAKLIVKGNISKALEMLPQVKDVPIQYSNGTHLAVDAIVTLQRKLEIEGSFFEILSGGNIAHIFLDEIAPSVKIEEIANGRIHPSNATNVMEYVFDIFRNTKINYLAITKDSTICDMCWTISPGIHEECLNCGSDKVDFMSRITGYMQPLSAWNEAKKQEFADRHRYKLSEIGG